MGIVLETLHCKKKMILNFLLYKLVDKTQKSAEDGCPKILSWLNFVFYSVPSSLAHQWIFYSEWVLSEWEFKKLIKTLQ